MGSMKFRMKDIHLQKLGRKLSKTMRAGPFLDFEIPEEKQILSKSLAVKLLFTGLQS